MFKADWVQFFLPSRIHLENGSLLKMGEWVSTLGCQRALLIKINDLPFNYSEEIKIAHSSLSKYMDGAIIYDDFSDEPTIDEIDSAVHFAKRSNVDVICILGSIRSINVGKIIALLTSNRTFAAELIQGKINFIYDALPIVVVPFEPTMGEEFFSSFILTQKSEAEIINISHDSLIPKICIYDPKLSIKLNKDRAALVTVSSLSYCIEGSISSRLNPFTETLLTQALTYIFKTAPSFCNEPYKTEFLTNMFWASIFIGASSNPSPQGINWALSKVLNQFFDINFYHSQAILLPYIMEYHLTSNPQVLINIAKIFGENINDISKIEAAIKAIEAIKKFLSQRNLPKSLSQINFDKRSIPLAASLAMKLPQIKKMDLQNITKGAFETFLLTAM